MPEKQKQKKAKRTPKKHKGGSSDELHKLIEMFLVVYKFRNGPVSIALIDEYVQNNFDNLSIDLFKNDNIYILTVKDRFGTEIITEKMHKTINQYKIKGELYNVGTTKFYYMYNRKYPYTCIISEYNGYIKFYYISNAAYTNNTLEYGSYYNDIGIQLYRSNMESELKKTKLKTPSKTGIKSRQVPQSASRGIKKYQRI